MTLIKKRLLRSAIIAVFVVAIFILALHLAEYVTANDTARSLVEQYGYFGVLFISIISGLNLFVPLPAALFVPIFTSVGYPIVGVIAVIVIGTTIADYIGYLIGIAGRDYTQEKHPKIIAFLKNIESNHRHWILPCVFLYAALSPFPNEVILIPLAMMGSKFRTLIAPLVLGTLVYQTILAFGAQSVFDLFF